MAARTPKAASVSIRPLLPNAAAKQLTAKDSKKPCTAHTTGIMTAPKVQKPSSSNKSGTRKYAASTRSKDSGSAVSSDATPA